MSRARPARGDETVTIFERSRAGPARVRARPPTDVPEVPVADLLPASPAARAPGRAARDLRAGDRAPLRDAVVEELRPRRGLLPARLVHDEAQPEAARARGGAARPRAPAPAPGPRVRAGRARADVAPAGRAGARSPGCRTCRCSRAPARTASWPGLLLTRAYHEDRGEQRDQGADARHRARHQPGHGDDGRLRGGQGRHRRRTAAWTSTTCARRPTDDVACLMLTNPNTLGLFDRNIEEIARIVHDVGATLYYDGANLNAVMGIARPGDMGFDIVHFNLHKTFTQPHGGGGPGAGPIAVSDRIEPFLPTPAGGRAAAATTAPSRLRPRLRPAQVDRQAARLPGQLRRVRALLRLHPLARRATGSRTSSQIAVLNANYLKARLAEEGIAEYLPIAFDRTCMHEFVLSGTRREGEARHQDARHRQAHARPRRAPADRLLPAARGRGADDRAHRDRDQGAPRPLRRRGARDPRGGGRGPGDRPQRALHDAGAPPRRGRRGQAAGGALAPGRREPRRPGARRRCRGRAAQERCSVATVPPGTADVDESISAAELRPRRPQPRAPAGGAALRRSRRPACTTC